MNKVLVIGAGNVGSVFCVLASERMDHFDFITLGSRTFSKCKDVQHLAFEKNGGMIEIQELDTSKFNVFVDYLRRLYPDLVVNTGLPYQNLDIMNACLEAGCHYLDTACYEHPEHLGFSYEKQLALFSNFKERGLTAILGCGFDPGMTNAWVKYAQEHVFSEIFSVNILDCNGGDHGQKFATNFSPEINIREFKIPAKFYLDGKWEIRPGILEDNPVRIEFDFPQVGIRDAYLIYHEELETLAKNIPGIKLIRFFMTFSERYIRNLRAIDELGFASIHPVMFKGQEIIPLEFLSSILPKSENFNKNYTGKTSILAIITGLWQNDGSIQSCSLLNVCDHAECFKRTGGNAVAFTTAVPAVAGAIQILSGEWKIPGVWNVEQLPVYDFMVEANKLGLTTELQMLEKIPAILEQNF